MASHVGYRVTTLVYIFLTASFFCLQAAAWPLDLSIPWSKSLLTRWPTSLASIEQMHPNKSPEKRQDGTYWYESIGHGISPFGAPGYAVFRNVKDFGAVGDGVTDDTAAINAAITAGDRCGENCGSSTLTPAVVYFPAGTYVVSAPLIQYYYTQFVGNPNAIPTLKASADFAGIAVISSDTYIPGGSGSEWYVSQSNFYRQVRNFIIDISACPNVTPDGFAPTGIHWQVAQATSLQNIQFIMAQGAETTHVGIFMENGSGGFLSDLVFSGGAIGMWCGNQQFTSRNLQFENCIQAIEMIWDWGWTWHGLNIFQCQIGINVTALTSVSALHHQGVGAIAVLDSVFTNVPIAVLTAGTTNIMLENVQLNNAPIAVGYSGGPTVLEGGDLLIDNYGNGNNFIQQGTTLSENVLNGAFDPSAKSVASPSLRTSSGWFARSKPQYETIDVGGFINVMSSGARGDGVTDDTAVINSVLASAGGSVVYFPHGIYVVTDTINIPPGTQIVGEAWSEIMGSGDKFADITNPHVMVSVGTSGSTGVVEISDMLFTVSGPTAGAILVEWDIAESSQGSAGMWDSHFRVGGAVGSQLQFDQCPWTESSVNADCIAATLLFHITSSASAYLENVWVWTADHDLDRLTQDQISIYTARAFLIESQGPVWLWATAAEHSTLYQYHFQNAQNVFGATLQTETPYYQPEPLAPAPFTGAYAIADDPTFSYCSPDSTTCAYAWGMEIIGSSNLMFYGAGFYSWFQWYNQACLVVELCQERIVRVINSNNIFIANLYTKGVYSMIQGSSTSDIQALQNIDGFLAEIVGWTGLDVVGSIDTPSSVIPLPAWVWTVPSPTVSCHIPCTVLPPPTPIFPIQPPVYSTTISNTPITVTPPVIETPYITVQPIPIVTPGAVTPLIVPTPIVPVPPIIPPAGNFPGGPPNVDPPPIPIPIPPSFIPTCVEFCSAADWPPVLPPIVVVDGDPLPVGAPPPDDDDDDDDDDDEADEEEDVMCPTLLPTSPTGYPTSSDQPSWAQPGAGTTGGTCQWSGTAEDYISTFSIAIASGQNSFTASLFDLLGFGSSSYSLDGAAMQIYSTSVSSWSVAFQPSGSASSDQFFINFDVPTNPLPTALLITGTLTGPASQIDMHVEIRASTACGGTAIPDPAGASGTGTGSGSGSSSPLPPIEPTNIDGAISCGTDTNGGGVDNMVYCLFTYGSEIIQGQLLSETSTITTQNPGTNCIRNGQTMVDGTITNLWCLVYEADGCAFVISDKDPLFGSEYPGFSVISGEVLRNFAVDAANQCAGLSKTAIAAGPFQPFNSIAQSLCLTSPDHPEICGVP
ncbi:pectate lyase superfamily protein-domain-containing protein [Xylariaceae sp. FL0255]|nr:pectate lyase superfamily protein-domain-containing protein [Xylariaceae sp. FL0255]